MSSQKNYSPIFKAKVALAALSGEKTTEELTSEYGEQPTMRNKWKNSCATPQQVYFLAE